MKRNQMDRVGGVARYPGQQVVVDALIARLEALAPGRCLQARDGTPFIRTDRICACFCNLVTGALCSARDICYRYGGVDEAGLPAGRVVQPGGRNG